MNLKYTTAQLGDGIGEGGFEYTSDAGRWLVVADTDKPAEVIVSDDGQVIAGPPRIAIAARDGDLSSLRASLAAAPEEMRRQHQGYPALHLAILFGHPDAVAALLAAGADPNQLDSQSQAPLELCALSNSLSDEESRQIALLLLEAGADRDRQSQDGETAKYYAESRGKLLLVSVL